MNKNQQVSEALKKCIAELSAENPGTEFILIGILPADGVDENVPTETMSTLPPELCGNVIQALAASYAHREYTASRVDG